MRPRFRSYDLAVSFYRHAIRLRLPHHLKDQLARAASSAALNLSEGAARTSVKEQRRFYDIAYASAKECKTIIELALPETHPLAEHIDSLAAHLYKLRLACST